jgi:GMP synthase-like glutamine amidotransferase
MTNWKGVSLKPILIFRHLQCEGPGYLADFLDRHDVPWHLIAVDEEQPIPKTLDGIGALVFMGGPMSVNDDLPWIRDELSLISQAGSKGMPVLGHCLGGQLIAKALGATVHANAVKEIGWHAVEKTGQASSWLADLPKSFEAFHWHGETFELPTGAELLLQSARCRHQAFAHGNMLALQCHVEMTADMVKEWADLNRKELANPSSSVQSYEALLFEVDRRITQLNTIADVLYERWLDLVRDRR